MIQTKIQITCQAFGSQQKYHSLSSLIPDSPSRSANPSLMPLLMGGSQGGVLKFQRHFYLMTGCRILKLIKTWVLPNFSLSHRLFFTLLTFYISTYLMAIYFAVKPGLFHNLLQPCFHAISVYLWNVQYLASTSCGHLEYFRWYIYLLTHFFHEHIPI